MAKARPITEEEFKRALAGVSGSRYPERDRVCLLLSARGGMRVGEIQGLAVEDVFDRHSEAVRDRVYFTADRVKWGHAREVHLNSTVRREVAGLLKVRGMDSGPLIKTQSSAPFSRTGLIGLFREMYRKVGLDTSSHAGRALFITSLADRGVSIRIIQKAVGHRSLHATQAYMDARPAEISRAVDLLR